MFKTIAIASLAGFALGPWGEPEVPLRLTERLQWEKAAFFQLPAEPDPAAEHWVKQYLRDLESFGAPADQQGVWLQSNFTNLAAYNGEQPFAAASLTKIATTLAALHEWNLEHRFETRLLASGAVRDGRLEGDLIVQGGGNPLLVWEEAIALGNALNKLGIRKVTGRLIVTGRLYMNFRTEPDVVGQLLQQAWDSEHWSAEIQHQYAAMPPGTPRPQLEIAGGMTVAQQLDAEPVLLLRQESAMLAEILKQMNIYSNNVIAEALAESLGGAVRVAAIAATAAGVEPEEIHLINGSGLGVENRLSPRAVVAMLQAVEERLQDSPYQIADLFPVAGRDRLGTMQGRQVPEGTALKTGTLNSVSALAGVLPTRDRGLVWFALINNGSSRLPTLRVEQDRLLRRLAEEWGSAPEALGRSLKPAEPLGDPRRIAVGAAPAPLP